MTYERVAEPRRMRAIKSLRMARQSQFCANGPGFYVFRGNAPFLGGQSMNEAHERLIKIGAGILQASRSELYLSMRFLDIALSALQYEMNLSTLHVGTDGVKILYNPRDLIQRYLSDRVLVNRAYLHMLLHCLFRHPFHIGERDEALWGLACDIAVESIVDGIDAKAVRLVVSDRRSEIYEMLRRELKTLSAEGIYRVLQQKKLPPREFGKLQMEFWVDDHSFWEKAQDDTQDSGQNENQTQEQQEEQEEQRRQELEQKWQEIGEKTETNMETFSKDIGEEMGTLLQCLRVENRERYNYRQFLRRFMTLKEEMRVDDDAYDYIFYTYGLSLYGNLPLIEALEYKESKKVEELAIAIDTSESCEGETIRRFLEETFAILKSGESFFRKVNIHIIQCDAQVQTDNKVTDAEDLAALMEEFEVRGSGGTDFRPVFRYVDSLVEQKVFRNLKGLIYFTDGYGIFPKKCPAYDTAFVFCDEDDTNRSVPPWAMKVVLGAEEIENLRPWGESPR